MPASTRTLKWLTALVGAVRMKHLLLATALTLVTSLPSAAASFDCAKARSRVEVLVCSDPGLSSLDDKLAATYRSAVSRAGDRRTLVRWQREWLDSDALSSCRDAKCVSREFAARIDILAQVAVEDAANGWTGTYVRVVNGKDDESAQVVLVRLTGARMAASGVAYWVGANAGQVNSGELNGIAHVDGARATFSESGCTAVLALRQRKLVVESEAGCGGLNVSFVGEYRRK